MRIDRILGVWGVSLPVLGQKEGGGGMTSFAIGGVKPPFIYNHLPVAYVVHKWGQLTNLKSWLKHDRILGLMGLKLYHIQLKVNFYSLFTSANCQELQNRFI